MLVCKVQVEEFHINWCDCWYCLYLKSAHGEQMFLSGLFPGWVASGASRHDQHEVLTTSSKYYNVLMGEGH